MIFQRNNRTLDKAPILFIPTNAIGFTFQPRKEKPERVIKNLRDFLSKSNRSIFSKIQRTKDPIALIDSKKRRGGGAIIKRRQKGTLILDQQRPVRTFSSENQEPDLTRRRYFITTLTVNHA